MRAAAARRIAFRSKRRSSRHRYAAPKMTKRGAYAISARQIFGSAVTALSPRRSTTPDRQRQNGLRDREPMILPLLMHLMAISVACGVCGRRRPTRSALQHVRASPAMKLPIGLRRFPGTSSRDEARRSDNPSGPLWRGVCGEGLPTESGSPTRPRDQRPGGGVKNFQ